MEVQAHKAGLIALMGQLGTEQVHFKSLNENMDTSTPIGQLTFHLFCALAGFSVPSSSKYYK